MMNKRPNERESGYEQNLGIRGTSRRLFIAQTLLASAVLPLMACGGSSASEQLLPDNNPPQTGLDTPGQLSTAQNIQSIIIIGAGIAGLVAGYELSRAGHQVTILEARNSSGGRVMTLRCPFDSDQFAEAGASRIPANHDLTLAYAQHFNLSLLPFYASTGDYFNLSGSNVSLTNASIYLNQPPWPGSVVRSDYFKISGGMSNLPEAFADALVTPVVYGQPVISVEQANNQVSVTTASGEVYRGDSVLCTVPLPVLGAINFSPVLSQAKVNAINGGFSYADSTRLFTQFSRRFWLESGQNGWGNTDWPEEVWQPTWDSSGEKGIIQSYLRGNTATQFDSLTQSQQLEQVHSRWQIALGDFASSIETSRVHSWQNEQWSGAAFAAPSFAQDSLYGDQIGRQEGQVHFAGEHASNYRAWIQGALQSGIRAAREIHG